MWPVLVTVCVCVHLLCSVSRFGELVGHSLVCMEPTLNVPILVFVLPTTSSEQGNKLDSHLSNSHINVINLTDFTVDSCMQKRRRSGSAVDFSCSLSASSMCMCV